MLQELWSLLCVDLFCLQLFSARHLLIPLFICVFCGDCIDPGYSQYHQSPVSLWTCSRFNPGDRALPFWNTDESNHHNLSISTQMYQARRLWVPVCWKTHGILLDDTCVLNSAEMMFRLEQGLENKIGSVTREEASFLLSTGAKNKALEVSERVQALDRAAGRNFGRRGSRGKIPGTVSTLWSKEVWILYNHTFSCLRAVRYLGFVDSLFKFCVNATAYHIATGSGTNIAGSSCSGRVTSFQSPNDIFDSGGDGQQLSSTGLRRQVLRSRGTFRSLCKL